MPCCGQMTTFSMRNLGVGEDGACGPACRTAISCSIPPTPRLGPAMQNDFWVFGYGSLMWRPGFVFTARHKAIVHGWRRRLCIYSHIYRGVPEKPGIVLGLDAGGECAGIAFQVS